MDREERRGGYRDDVGIGRGRRLPPEAILRERARQQEQQRDVHHVQEHVRHMEAEWPGAPDGAIDGVGEIHDGPRDLIEQETAEVERMR